MFMKKKSVISIGHHSGAFLQQLDVLPLLSISIIVSNSVHHHNKGNI